MGPRVFSGDWYLIGVRIDQSSFGVDWRAQGFLSLTLYPYLLYSAPEFNEAVNDAVNNPVNDAVNDLAWVCSKEGGKAQVERIYIINTAIMHYFGA
jgi:hypothetical protein